MIDSSIYKVYKENQQVFIPEFGAIIHSEVSDSPSFNAMLNFDDGKVIEAIMEKQSVGEDEAKALLQEHVQKIKDKLDEGKSHYIRGLGHMYKDELDSYAVSKKKPSLDFSNTPIIEDKEIVEDSEFLDSVQDEFDSTFESAESDNLAETTLDEFPIADQIEDDSDFSSFISNTDEDLENQIENTEEDSDHQFEISSENIEEDFSFNDESSSTDFSEDSEDTSWKDDDSDFSYDEENFEDDDSQSDPFYKEEGKGNRVFLTLTIAVILLFVVSAIGYYFLFYENDEKAADQNSAYNTALASAKDEDSKKEAKKSDDKAATTANEVKTSPAANQPANSVSANQYANGQGPAYSVILGSFKVENNANNFQRYLQERGMQVAIFRRDNDFHFVGFEEIPGKTNAMGLLSEMRTEEPTAWIIRK